MRAVRTTALKSPSRRSLPMSGNRIISALAAAATATMRDLERSRVDARRRRATHQRRAHDTRLRQRLHTCDGDALHGRNPHRVLPLTRSRKRTCGGDQPTQHPGHRGQLERLLRRLQRRRRRVRRPDPVRPDLARLLPIAERWCVVHELAGAWLPGRHLAVRCPRAGPHRLGRRPGTRVGRRRTIVRRV